MCALGVGITPFISILSGVCDPEYRSKDLAKVGGGLSADKRAQTTPHQHTPPLPSTLHAAHPTST